MRVLQGFDDLPPLRNPVVTVGSYDGVHAGHRELLGRIVRLAAEQGGESVVVTFSPHPRTVLGNRGETVQLLNTLLEKIFLLERIGIDNLIVAPFTEAFSRISPAGFVRDYLVGKLGVGTLVVGYDHRFGHNQEGDPGTLDRLQREFGFSIYEVPKREMDADKVSSTAIRRLIAAGDMARAERMLGYPYIVIVSPGADGKPHSDDPRKLIPPAGTYRVATGVLESNAPRTLSGGEPCAPDGGSENACHAATTAEIFAGPVESGSKRVLYIGADKTLSLDPPIGAGRHKGKILITFLS